MESLSMRYAIVREEEGGGAGKRQVRLENIADVETTGQRHTRHLLARRLHPHDARMGTRPNCMPQRVCQSRARTNNTQGTFVAAFCTLLAVVSRYYPDKPSAPRTYPGGLEAELGGPRAVRARKVEDEETALD